MVKKVDLKNTSSWFCLSLNENVFRRGASHKKYGGGCTITQQRVSGKCGLKILG